MTLYIDSSVREDSRTRRLADRLVSRIVDGNVRTIRLQDEHLRPFDAAALDQRNREIEAGMGVSPLPAMAAEFAAADQIVIAAPFWDLSFPALLRVVGGDDATFRRIIGHGLRRTKIEASRF